MRWQVSRLADVEACTSAVGPPSRPLSGQWLWATSPVTVAGAAVLGA